MKHARDARSVSGVSTEPAQFEAFYREHLFFVSRYVARRLTDPHDVADVTADIFLKVIGSASAYRPAFGPPRAWLTGIARNTVIDHQHATARRDATARRFAARRWLDEESTDRIIARVAAEAPAQALLAAIAELPDSLRAVVELVAVDELALRDAAAVLNISAGAARVRYHRARHLLRTTPAAQEHEVMT